MDVKKAVEEYAIAAPQIKGKLKSSIIFYYYILGRRNFSQIFNKSWRKKGGISFLKMTILLLGWLVIVYTVLNRDVESPWSALHAFPLPVLEEEVSDSRLLADQEEAAAAPEIVPRAKAAVDSFTMMMWDMIV